MSTPPIRIEQSIVIRAGAERVFALLTDPNHMPHFTAGVEAAAVLGPGPDGGIVGSRLELGTASGRILAATVKEFVPGRRLVVEDENGVVSTWSVEPVDDERVRLTNVLVGNIPTARANRLRFTAEVKFQAIAQFIEQARADAEPRQATGGANRVTGTARTPR